MSDKQVSRLVLEHPATIRRQHLSLDAYQHGLQFGRGGNARPHKRKGGEAEEPNHDEAHNVRPRQILIGSDGTDHGPDGHAKERQCSSVGVAIAVQLDQLHHAVLGVANAGLDGQIGVRQGPIGCAPRNGEAAVQSVGWCVVIIVGGGVGKQRLLEDLPCRRSGGAFIELVQYNFIYCWNRRRHISNDLFRC